MLITKNFRGAEFYPPDAPEQVKANVGALVKNILQPIRDELGLAMTISSGWRTAEANRRAGGVDNSQHLTGEAADFVIRGYSGVALCREILKAILARRPKFDQLIVYERFVHISHTSTRDNRGQIIFKNPSSACSLMAEEIKKLINSKIPVS